MSLFRASIPSAALIAMAVSIPAAQTKAPRIPTCAGLPLVTAVNDATGDYESIKTIESASDNDIRIKYSAQKMDYGDMFGDGRPTLKTYVSRRVVLREDMQTSRSYLQEFATVIPEAVPGMTALGTSTLVLQELKEKGNAEFGISHLAFAVPMVRAAARRVAVHLGLPEDWLNDGAKGYVHGMAPGEMILTTPGLLVRTLAPQQLLAMKLSAWRDDIDIEDARLLLSKVAGNQERVWRMVEPYLVPGRELKARYAFEDLWEAYRAS